MDYKKKLKQRLHYGVICIVLGVIMIIGVTRLNLKMNIFPLSVLR